MNYIVRKPGLILSVFFLVIVFADKNLRVHNVFMDEDFSAQDAELNQEKKGSKFGYSVQKKISEKVLQSKTGLLFLVTIISLGISFLGAYLWKSGNLPQYLDQGIQVALNEESSENKVDNMVPDGYTKLQIPEREPAFFSLRPTTTSVFGILPREVFTLTTLEETNLSEIQTLVNANSGLQVQQLSPTEYQLQPRNPLAKEEDVVIKFETKGENIGGQTLDRDYSWAFQTQADFQLESTIPGNEKTNVPLNTGIEFTFNQAGFSIEPNQIEITPTFEYKTEVRNQTFVIIPIDPLKAETNYTVTLKRGINLLERNDPIEEDLLLSFQTEELQDSNNSRIYPDDSYLQFTPNELAQIKVQIQEWSADTLVTAEIFQFGSVDEFVLSRAEIDQAENSWWHYYPSQSDLNTRNLEKVYSSEITVQSLETEPYETHYLELPQALPVGLYVAELTYGDNKKVHVWLQSTFLSGYVTVGRKDTLVWLNTIDQTNPVDFASLHIIGTSSFYRTNDEGVAVFNTPTELFENKRHYIEAKSRDDRWVLLPVATLADKVRPDEISKDDYWSYIYHEKMLYKPGDRVAFWGVIKDRANPSAQQNLEVALSRGYYYNNNNQPTETLVATNVTTRQDGTFIGEVVLPETLGENSWLNLTVSIGDTVVTDSSISVFNYQKPELEIEVETSKRAVFAGESVDHQVQVSFFDGTPASYIPVNIIEGNSSKKELTTDTSGRATATQTTSYDSSYDYYPRFEGITFEPAIAQDQIVTGYGSVQVFGSEYQFTSERNISGNTATLTTQLEQLSLDRYNAGESDEVERQVVANTDVRMQITAIWYETKEDGTYYDFIEKTTRKRYKSVRHTEVMENTTFKTSASGQIQHSFEMRDKTSYEVELFVTDPGGREERDSIYFYNSKFSDQSSDEKPSLTLLNSDNLFSKGEDVRVEVHSGDGLVETNPKTRFLYTVAGKGNQRYTLSDSPQFNFVFGETEVPNSTVGALIFDGESYTQALGTCNYGWQCSNYYYNGVRRTLQFNGINLAYDTDESKLDLQLSSDQNSYQPGESASVTIEVSHNGQPVSGATVHLAVVDQALAAIGGVKKPSILSSLYSYVPNGMYYMYYSHQALVPDPSQAEMGGGGGGPRELFKDTPYFGTATTNSEGQATISFDLPDNITTWLMYAQAVTTDLDVGDTSYSAPATLDFFVTNNFPPKVLSQDNPSTSLNTFGIGVNQTDLVDYSLVLEQSGVELGSWTKQNNVFKETEISLGNLEVGSYRLIADAKARNYQDAVAYPIEVIATRQDLSLSETKALKAGETLTQLETNLQQSDSPIKLSIYDTGKGLFYRRLRQMCYQHSNRVEKIIARAHAVPLVQKYYDQGECANFETSIGDFQNADGGVSLVEWGSSELSPTVWAIFTGDTNLDTNAAKNYLSSKVNQSSLSVHDRVLATWGLSLLNEPKLLALQQLEQRVYTYSDRVVLALALATAGDTERARNMYLDLLADYGYQNLEYIRIQDGGGVMTPLNDRYLVDTSYALVLSSLLDFEYSRGLYNYLAEYRYDIDNQVIDLAEINFIEHRLEELPNEDTVIELTSPSQNLERTITKGKVTQLTIPAGDIEDFSLAVSAGAADVVAEFSVPTEMISQIPQDERLSIKRSYENLTQNKTNVTNESQINVGDIIKVTLDIDIDRKSSPQGRYQVREILPSGFKYLRNPSYFGYDSGFWMQPVSDQSQVYMAYFYNSWWWHDYRKPDVTYYIRAAHLGEYVAEPALVQSSDTLSVFALSKAHRFRITSKSE